MDQPQTAADILFPPPVPAAPAAPRISPAPVAPARPAQAAPTPAQPSDVAEVAIAGETPEQRIERLFQFGDKPVVVKASAAEAKAAPAADVLPDFLDPAHADTAAVAPMVKELGLGRDQFGKLQALHTQMASAAIERQSATWASEASKLPPAEIQDARDAISKFGTPELKAVLNKTGLGNNPEVIRAFAKAIQAARLGLHLNLKHR